MKFWTYAANSYYKTASYILEEGPWYSFVIESLIETICESLMVIPIPFGSNIKIKRDFLDNGEYETYTLKEWYGSLGDIFHVYICSPISEFCYKKRQETHLNTDYEQLKKERYKESPDIFEE